MIPRRLLFAILSFAATVASAQEPAAAPAAAPAAQQATNTAVGAAVATGQAETGGPDFIEHVVDSALEIFDVRAHGNTVTHYIIAAVFLVLAVVLRRVVTAILFSGLKKVASRTRTTFDDKLFVALEAPVSAFIMLVGIFSALKVLKLSDTTDRAISYGSTVAFTLVVFWALVRTVSALLDHAAEIATERKMGVAAFMPWIKKSLVTLFIIFGVLMVIQSLGYNVRAILAGLGIGGLAFALAAQDTLANLFGSVVVAIDQPFKLGEFVQIGSNAGAVEDIGLRSTKLRRADKALVIVPNKTVAAEPILNLSRFTGRRVEQVFGLTYDTPAEQLESLVEEIRTIVRAEKYVDATSILVFFRDLSASSLDIWCAYNTGPDFPQHMETRQRVNLTIMRAVERRGLSFAFPTQTVHVASLPPASSPSAEPATVPPEVRQSRV